ncbi:hypothetical protein Syun_012238 [Stephania yunnanensis]|uniref:Uncharacterized protein n=1 Tax=Stephania yunnanensis TaxID=152371 RepID=A0AAP0PF46_9MAGN
MEAKLVDSPPQKKNKGNDFGHKEGKRSPYYGETRRSYGVQKKKGKEILVLDIPVGLMRFEYNNTHQIAPIEGFDREVALRQVCKDPDFDVTKTPKTGELTILTHLIHVVDQRDSDDEDNKESKGEDQLDIYIIENDSEVDSAQIGGYKPSVDEDRDSDVGNVAVGGDFNKDGITQSMGDYEFLVSTPPKVNEEGVLLGAVMLDKKAELSRKIIKEFVEKLDQVVQECDKALHDRMAQQLDRYVQTDRNSRTIKGIW